MEQDDPVRHNRTCLELFHSGAKEGVVLIHRILRVIMQSHSRRQSLPGNSHLPGPLERSYGGKKNWHERSSEHQGDVGRAVTEPATRGRREPGQSPRNIMLPQPRVTYSQAQGQSEWPDASVMGPGGGCLARREGVGSGYC